MASLSLRLPEELDAKLEHEASEAGVPRSELVRVAVSEFLHRRERERFLAAFVREARATYGDPSARAEALAVAAEALASDNEALDAAEGLRAGSGKAPAVSAARPRRRKESQ